MGFMVGSLGGAGILVTTSDLVAVACRREIQIAKSHVAVGEEMLRIPPVNAGADYPDAVRLHLVVLDDAAVAQFEQQVSDRTLGHLPLSVPRVVLVLQPLVDVAADIDQCEASRVAIRVDAEVGDGVDDLLVVASAMGVRQHGVGDERVGHACHGRHLRVGKPPPGYERNTRSSRLSGSYSLSTTRSLSGMMALSVMVISSGQTLVQHFVMLQ